VSVGVSVVGRLSLRPPKRILPYIVSKYSSTTCAIGYVLIIVKSKDFEPAGLSIMCDYGKSQMLSENNWLSNGNRLGKMLMKIREELRKEQSCDKEC